MPKGILNIVVMGEVDSGKSTLIGRVLYDSGSIKNEHLSELTHISKGLDSDLDFAYLLDSFEEERKQEFTLDTTQVFCKSTSGRKLVFIDVPGHYALIRNMLSGSSYAEIGVLVVDVQKGLEPQTKMHARILNFLGVEQIILAVNKMDLIRFGKVHYERAVDKITGYLNSIGLKTKYCIPISAKYGYNVLVRSKYMPWYEGLLLMEAMDAISCKKNSNNISLRFSIQDIYKFGTQKIAVGSILSGRIKKGELTTLLPLNSRLKVQAIKVFDKKINTAGYPKSIGLILSRNNMLKRGQVICCGRLPNVSMEFKAKLFCVQPIKRLQGLTFKCVNQSVKAGIKGIKKLCDKFAEVTITVAQPVVIDEFHKHRSLGRFVLEKNNEIYAIGIIT